MTSQRVSRASVLMAAMTIARQSWQRFTSAVDLIAGAEWVPSTEGGYLLRWF